MADCGLPAGRPDRNPSRPRPCDRDRGCRPPADAGVRNVAIRSGAEAASGARRSVSCSTSGSTGSAGFWMAPSANSPVPTATTAAEISILRLVAGPGRRPLGSDGVRLGHVRLGRVRLGSVGNGVVSSSLWSSRGPFVAVVIADGRDELFGEWARLAEDDVVLVRNQRAGATVHGLQRRMRR